MFKTIFCALSGVILLGFTMREITGEVEIKNSKPKEEINLPENFDPEIAEKELINARESGNKELSEKLSKYINEWWKMNRKEEYSPMLFGYNNKPGKELRNENSNPNSNILKWGNDVRIDSRNNVYDVKITSLSNGELYTISAHSDGSAYHFIVHRSTDNGATWNIYWDYTFSSGYKITSPGILSVNDTLVLWYILIKNDTLFKTWFITTLPGNSPNVIYFGSPTGNFKDNVVYYNLDFTTDAPIRGTDEWNYATWVEMHYKNNPSIEDSTRVMFARTNELNVSNWELGPVRVKRTIGDNVYYRYSKIAYGYNNLLWIIAPLHPYGYPTTYDETIHGFKSTDFGNSWSNVFNITPNSDHFDDFEADIAASYVNSNWTIIVTRTDTGVLHGNDMNLYNYYTTDGGLS